MDKRNVLEVGEEKDDEEIVNILEVLVTERVEEDESAEKGREDLKKKDITDREYWERRKKDYSEEIERENKGL